MSAERQPEAVERPARATVDWRRRAIVIVVAAVGILLLALVGSAFIPRWWAQRVGDQVDGSFAAGVGLGLFYGFVFTGLALVGLWLTFRRRRPWKLWGAGLVISLLLAAPNLMTLGVVLGRGSAAHAGERIMDVEAPAFRASTLIGSIAAAVLVGAWRYLVASRRSTRRKMRRLEQQMRDETAEG